MAGSVKWMIYKDDSNKNYLVKIDESNGESTGFVDYTGETDISYLPKGFQMRQALVVDPVSGARRSIPVGDKASDIWTGVAVSVLLYLVGIATPGNVAFSISRLIGESAARAVAADSGLTDGDAT